MEETIPKFVKYLIGGFLLLVALVVLGSQARHKWVMWRFEDATRLIGRSASGGLSVTGRYTSQPSIAELDTFSDPVSSADLRDLFLRVDDRLQEKLGLPRLYYRWSDFEGYPGFSSVYVANGTYIELRAFQANDNNSLSLYLGERTFSENEMTTVAANDRTSYLGKTIPTRKYGN